MQSMRMRGLRVRLGLGLGLLTVGLVGPAAAWDVFNTSRNVSPGPATGLLPGSDGQLCRQGVPPAPLPLFEAIERSLCGSPRTRSAWAGVKAAAAGLGLAKSAYLPTVDVTAQYSRDHAQTTVDGPPDLGTRYTQNYDSESVSLAWVLYDFGGRSAALKSGKQLLLAAQANQNTALQAAFATTATHYYAAQAAAAKVESTRRIEAGSQKSLDAAAARYNTGVAPVTDQLQANTAHAQAVYERAAAEGAYQAALGVLAVDMSLPPDTMLTMPPLDAGALPNSEFVHAVHDLLDEATQNHPSVVAAKAQWQAALANVDITRAQGLPKISLTGTFTHADEPLNANIGTLTYPAHVRDATAGISVTMPLFEGFAGSYRVRQAEAEAQVQEQALRDAQQQVAIAVWTGVQTLEADTENLRNIDVVVQSARAAFDAARQRYASGVGTILELLSSQTVLAGAEQQYITAQLEWRAARLQLAASLGNLGMWALK
jgi:outer membrane protein